MSPDPKLSADYEGGTEALTRHFYRLPSRTRNNAVYLLARRPALTGRILHPAIDPRSEGA